MHLLNSSFFPFPSFEQDPEAVAVLEKALVADGVVIEKNISFHSVSHDKERSLFTVQAIGGRAFTCNALLVATGRSPNIEGLDLGNAGVQANATAGIIVNDQLQSSNPHIFAAGDCCSAFKFTHAADFQARTVLRNALFFGKAKVSNLLIPWCT